MITVLIDSCDEGFSEPFCVPTKPLPMMLRDDFNTETVVKDNWREIYGGENTDTCGNLVSGNALAFHKVIVLLKVLNT